MAHTPIEREEPPRERATLPVRLALVDAGLSDPHACLDHLSHDLLEALDVYEHHIPLPAYGAARVIDSRVYTLSPADADTSRTWTSLCEQLHSDEHAGHARTPLLYAIACADEHGFIQARMALERLGSACRAEDVPWGGGIAVGGGLLVSASVRSPRMGRMRRHTLELRCEHPAQSKLIGSHHRAMPGSALPLRPHLQGLPALSLGIIGRSLSIQPI